MTKSILSFFGEVAWPLAVLVIFYYFRSEIRELLSKTQGITVGPVHLKMEQVKKAEEARGIAEKSTSKEEAAKQILQDNLVDMNELRILRNLIGESEGRALNDFKRNKFYRPALGSLIAKKFIFYDDGNYFLTSLGTEIAKIHIVQALGRDY